MKLSRLNIRGSLCTLGRIVDEKEFSALICVISTLKHSNENYDEVPEEFSYEENEFHTKEKFIKSCRMLAKLGYCKCVGREKYSFTDEGMIILEAWDTINVKRKWAASQ